MQTLKHYRKTACKKIKSIYAQGIAHKNKFFDISCTRRRNLDKLEEDLRDIVEDLKLQTPHDAGLIKESFSYVRSLPKQGIYRDPLPKHKIKTLHYLEELVGIGAEKGRTALALNIKDTPKKTAQH